MHDGMIAVVASTTVTSLEGIHGIEVALYCIREAGAEVQWSEMAMMTNGRRSHDD